MHNHFVASVIVVLSLAESSAAGFGCSGEVLTHDDKGCRISDFNDFFPGSALNACKGNRPSFHTQNTKTATGGCEKTANAMNKAGSGYDGPTVIVRHYIFHWCLC